MVDPFVAELQEDHREIEGVLDAIERQISSNLPLPVAFLTEAIKFLEDFGDEYHHFKEEEVFFPYLASQGVKVESGPIGQMLGEHAELRKLLAAIHEALPLARKQDERAARALRQLMGRYICVLRQHIEREEDLQFELGQRLMNQDTGLLLSDIVARQSSARLSAVRLAQLRTFAANCQHRVEIDECYTFAKV